MTDTGSNAEETGAAAGWTIANAYHFKSSSNVWGPTGFGTSFLITIKGTLGTTNTAPTGVPTITGTAQVGQTLTAVTTGIMDADGLTSPTYTYQWIRGNGTESRHFGREFEHLRPGRRRPGQDHQGQGELHRRRQPYRDAHQRGDGDGGSRHHPAGGGARDGG